MAVLRAVRATDMRTGLAEGFVVSSNRSEIKVADGTTLGNYSGVFVYNYGALPNVGIPFYGSSLTGTGLTPGFAGGFVNGSFSTGGLTGAGIVAGGTGGISIGIGVNGGIGGIGNGGVGSGGIVDRGIVTGGTLTGYSQIDAGGNDFAISQFEVSAAFAFRSLAFGDSRLLQSVIFASADTIFGSKDNDVLQGFTGSDLIWGNGGSDRIFGQQGLDRLYGLDGNDRIYGGGDRDTLYGGDDNDVLWGGAANDILFGESGNDRLIGGLGRDILTGGSGNDVFRFDSVDDSPPSSSQRDVIEDFGNGADLIDLRRIDANETQPGNQAFVFIGSAPFSDVAGQLRYVPGMVSGDTDGDGSADFAIRLDGNPVLDASDFLL